MKCEMGHLVYTTNHLKSLRCTGCNEIRDTFYEIALTKPVPIDKEIEAVDNGEDYARGLCSKCMCELIIESQDRIYINVEEEGETNELD